MRRINSKEIENLIGDLIRTANFILPEKVRAKLEKFRETETEDLPRAALQQICENYRVAENEKLPLCQDCGAAIFFVEIGHEIILSEPIGEILNRAVEKFYREFFLRKSIANPPIFNRKNSGDNLPAFVHLKQISGQKLKIQFVPKGGGSENKSRLKMLSPVAGATGVKDFVVETVRAAGGAACPPFLIGVGVGGTFDTVGGLAKEAILRGVDSQNSDPQFAKLEKEIAAEVENLKVGAAGFGGKNFLLGLNLEFAPCHIASLPTAVNIQCHVARATTGEI
jgi:fumarate hydratase subunit alpha